VSTPRRRHSTSRASGFIEALEASFSDALRGPDGAAEPAALLWTDGDGQWASMLPILKGVFSNLFSLGGYDPGERQGPAIWLRCVVDRSLPDIALPAEMAPIIYLPGVARQALRAGMECPASLQPLIELQYRGRVWHQRNGNDWTVDAFLSSEDGLGLDIAQDNRTKEAFLRALPLLADIPLDGLRTHRLEADDFDRLSVDDPVRDLLRWIAAGDRFRTGESESRWKSFCSVCRTEFGFDPEKKSVSDAAVALVAGSKKWDGVWQRFREAPRVYPGVAEALRGLPADITHPERTPQANANGEKRLRREFSAIATMPQAQTIEAILALEKEHGRRRDWVWAQLGESTLAAALEPLARLATGAKTPLGGATIEAAITAYASGGWLCDRAALEALGAVHAQADAQLIGAVVKSLYEPWLDASARHFQSLIAGAEQAARALVSGTEIEKDVCVLFVDGLRFDVAGLLKERLDRAGLQTRLGHRLAPLPTVTATGKPLATTVADALEGNEDRVDFNPQLRETHQAVSAQRLCDEMSRRKVDLLDEETRPSKEGAVGGWAETGHLDGFGHSFQIELAGHVEKEISLLVDRISSLLECGWRRVRVVTDHGWLLLPGGLPKVEMPAHLTSTKWARCATVRGQSQTDLPVYGWHWNPRVRIASPPGIACFIAGNAYAHGGISPQECIVPDLIVERGGASASAAITAVSWRGMRCRVSVTTNDPSVKVDIRLNWKQPATSIAALAKEVGPAGEASLAVPDDSHEGMSATVVIVDAAGNVLDRKPTTVGEPS
jgi:hypothetical protein